MVPGLRCSRTPVLNVIRKEYWLEGSSSLINPSSVTKICIKCSCLKLCHRENILTQL